jgi:uncharacterized membrane protein YcaP (DUF421 family)
MGEVFFQGWGILFRTVLVGVLAYGALVVILRISGRRTLSKMNAFDFIVTVALGSTLANILINQDIALAEGTVSLALLVALQYAITWTSVRVSWVRRAVTGRPILLLYRGVVLQDRLRAARVTHDELRAAVRNRGLAALEDVEAVVLETDGAFSVIESGGSSRSSLNDLDIPDELRGPAS